MDELCGNIERITYQNKENNFLVAKLQPNGSTGEDELITITGNMPGVFPGLPLKLGGDWVNHRKYGKQFKVSRMKMGRPDSETEMIKYLGSGLIKGIGPVMAERIVTVFGHESLDIMENDPQSLKQVEGIGEKRVAMIDEPSPPHTRGCTVRELTLANNLSRLPRTRGDVPWWQFVERLETLSPPHTRGCTASKNRKSTILYCLPRTRGDVPIR